MLSIVGVNSIDLTCKEEMGTNPDVIDISYGKYLLAQV